MYNFNFLYITNLIYAYYKKLSLNIIMRNFVDVPSVIVFFSGYLINITCIDSINYKPYYSKSFGWVLTSIVVELFAYIK